MGAPGQEDSEQAARVRNGLAVVTFGQVVDGTWEGGRQVEAVDGKHPQYCEKYAANLKRELPRIPFAPDFRGFVASGAKLAELHVNYEKQPEYPLHRLENKDAQLNWLVERMRLSKDKTQLVYNDFLALGGIPPESFEYRLGNRSALEWIVISFGSRPTSGAASSTTPTGRMILSTS